MLYNDVSKEHLSSIIQTEGKINFQKEPHSLDGNVKIQVQWTILLVRKHRDEIRDELVKLEEVHEASKKQKDK